MTRYLNNITYTPTSRVNNQCVAVIVCDSSVDSDFVIDAIGTDNTGAVTGEIEPVAAIVDNLNNANTATIKYGPQQYGVAPYTRRTFALPYSTQTVEILVTSGTVTLTLCQTNMQVPDEQNMLAASGGLTVGEYNPYFQVVGPTPVASELFFAHFFEEPVQYQNNFNGAVGGVDRRAGVNPAAPYVCTVYKNGVAIGTITYGVTGAAVFATVGGTNGTYSVGDCMSVQGAVTPDGSLQNFSATFAMTPV